MKNKSLVKIETYKDIDLFYNKDNARIMFDFEGKQREVKYIFEAREIIDEPVWEKCDLRGFFIDGTFHDYIGLAKAVQLNIKDQKPRWLYKGKYDVDYKLPNFGGEKVYLFSDHNAAIYKEFEIQKSVMSKEANKLQSIISKLT